MLPYMKVIQRKFWFQKKGAYQMKKMVYTVKEVAELLGISRSYAYELVKEKKLPVLDLGRRKVIPKNRFDEWIRENSGIPTA